MNEARGAVASAFVLLFFALPAAMLAQDVVHPLEGQRVRLTLREPALNATRAGIVLRMTSDSVALRNPDGSAETFPRRQVLRVEVSSGGNWARGALTGLAAGAAVGFLGFKLWADARYSDDDFNARYALIFGMPVGGLVGAIVGSARTQERWLPAQLDVAVGPDFRFSLRLKLTR